MWILLSLFLKVCTIIPYNYVIQSVCYGPLPSSCTLCSHHKVIQLLPSSSSTCICTVEIVQCENESEQLLSFFQGFIREDTCPLGKRNLAITHRHMVLNPFFVIFFNCCKHSFLFHTPSCIATHTNNAWA